MKKQIQIAVCGTNYGSTYLSAISLVPEFLQLRAILARKSERSLAAAKQFKVPLCGSVSELPDGIEIACVALPKSVSQITLQLLERDINVLCEHPQEPDFLDAAVSFAKSRDLKFHLNGHFSQLPAPASFIVESCKIRETDKPVFVNVTATDRSLYAALNILKLALGALLPAQLSEGPQGQYFRFLAGTLGDLDATISFQDGKRGYGRQLEDFSRSYMTDIQITLVFPNGTLHLASISGPVVWNRNYQRAAGPERLWDIVGSGQLQTTQSLNSSRIAANLDAIRSLVEHIGGGECPREQAPAHFSEVSRVWQEISGRRQSLLQ